MEPVSTTARLAEYAATLRYDDLPAEVVLAVKRMMLDALGTALAAGTLGEGCKELVAMVAACGGQPEATILGFGHRGPAALVALANGGLVHALNYDAGGAGHLGVVALVAPLAAAEQVGGATGKDLITAAAAACEVTARISMPANAADREGRDRPWLAGQVLGYFGAAAGAGRIYGLSPSEMHSAFGLAGMQASGARQVVLDGDPPAKAIYGAFTNQGGVQAALLSKFGLRADCAAIEGKGGFYAVFFGDPSPAEAVTAGLGERFVCADVRFKPYPTSGVVQPFIEAALDLRQRHKLSGDIVERVEFRGAPRIQHWCEPVEERRAPSNAASAANSIFFGVGNALAYGEVPLANFQPAGLADPRILAITARASFRIEPDPAAPASVTVWTTDGRCVTTSVDDSATPISDEQIVAKFMDCVRYAPRPIDPETASRVAEHIMSLEDRPDGTACLRLIHP
jgi:2-methylcitrate dehydratase PrpD